jgi:catechol 2,3-dioxygenase-like lactoylglutathione lyase family enzyme
MDTNSKPNINLAVPFFGVANMEVSLRFYVEGLGFTMTRQWTPRGKVEWCWLERDAVALMLQSPGADKEPLPETAARSEAAATPKSGPNICFQCQDALALYHEFKARGLTLSEPFVGNGRWVIGLRDPDGYHLEFESITAVAEETTYGEWVKSS